MVLEPGPNQTVLVGDVRDQAHLYGPLDRLRDFGIELLAVEAADSSDSSSTAGLPGGLGTRLTAPPDRSTPGHPKMGLR